MSNEDRVRKAKGLLKQLEQSSFGSSKSIRIVEELKNISFEIGSKEDVEYRKE